MPVLHLLSAGAARALAEALAPGFTAQAGARLDAEYGAVGAMRERLLAGAPCDVVILTAALIDKLREQGLVLADSIAPLGTVRTGIAVPAGEPMPAIGNAGQLRAALLAAAAIYFPDPARATAGIHFAGVLDRLAIADTVASRLRPFANGAAAMSAMAAAASAAEHGAIGCTQATEIIYTPGVSLVGPLPREFELGTVYSVAVTAAAVDLALARRFAALLCGDAAAALRHAGGFEVT
jgi:molybdate transport system substrate-binding protein